MGAPLGNKNAARRVVIYSLSDPDTLEVRYIGKTINVKKRLDSHLHPSVFNSTPVAKWTRSLKERRKCPILSVLQSVLSEEWESVEITTIKQYRDLGYRLLNISVGGLETKHIKERHNYPSYRWVMRFCARTRNRDLGALIRGQMDQAKLLGQEFASHYDRYLFDSVRLANPLFGLPSDLKVRIMREVCGLGAK